MHTFCTGKICAIWVTCLFFPAVSLFAQQHFSLQQLISAADNHLPLLKQKQALTNAATATVTDTRHSFLPKLSFSEQVNIASNNSLAGTYFGFGITPSSSAGVRNDNTLDPATANIAVLYSEYELVNFGLNTAKLQYANANAVLQDADFKKEQYTVQLAVARLYFNVLKNQYRLNADKQNVARYQDIFTIIQALTSSGLTAGADSSLAKAELSKTRIIYNQTLGRLNQIKEQLALFTGVPAAQLIIDTPAIAAIDTNAALSYTADTVYNPLTDYYVKRKNSFLVNDALIRKSYLPKIMLASALWARGSSIQYSDDFKGLQTGLGYQRFNYAVGLAFTYNLFNGLYKKDKIRINNYQVQASDFDLQQQTQSVNSALLQARQAIQTTTANLFELPVQLAAAEATFNQKTAQYKAGIISLIDLTNASFVLYRSQTDYIETISDWYLARLDIAAYNGTLSQFINSIK